MQIITPLPIARLALNDGHCDALCDVGLSEFKIWREFDCS